MKKHRFLLYILCVSVLLSLAAPAHADFTYTVTFYTDANMTTVHDVQQVAEMGHPTVPSTPAAYEAGGYRYEFDHWYWKYGGNAAVFSFTSDDCMIWSDSSIFAGYTQYLAEGYVMIVTVPGSQEGAIIDNTTTPVSALLSGYGTNFQVRIMSEAEFTHGTGSDKAASAVVGGQTKSYATLGEAVAAVDVGGTVTLLGDVALTSPVTLSRAMTLDLGGCALTGSTVNVAAAVTVDGTAENARLSSALNVTANGVLTLGEGNYEGMVLTVELGGGAVITGGTFTFDPSAYVTDKTLEVKAAGGKYSVVPHVHSFDHENPAWTWGVKDGDQVANAAYPCACGEKETVTVTPTYEDLRGIRVYTARDAYGNETSRQETLVYTVTVDGVVQSTTYRWGDICVVTADGPRAWYVGTVAEGNKVADGTGTHTFAVTENTVLRTQASQYTEAQAAVRATMTSPAAGKAVFNAKWSLPKGAQVSDVTIYRGYTTADMTVSAKTMVDYGKAFTANLLVRNGDFTLNLTNLTPSNYQHAVIVISYTVDGQAKTLTSAVQKVLPSGN